MDNMKNFLRAMWLVAVALGGVVLVGLAVSILNLDSKKYIEL
jgi:hypothetical protein